MPSFKPVIALARGLEVLRVVNEEGQSTIRSLHKATALDKATIVRMLETLEHEGYVMRNPEQAVYMPTGRTLMLSQGYDSHLWIGSICEPILNEFRSQIGWPSDVAIYDQDAMVVVQSTRGRQGPITFNRKPGFRAPVLMTSLGLAYLAFCGQAERERIIALLGAIPGAPTELARHPRKLQSVLQGVRESGYAVMDEAYSQREYDGLVWAFSVPVRRGEEVFASINIMTLKSAITSEEAIAKFLGPLQETANRLADALAVKSSTAGRGG
jgi:IclR family transcriptional regulator, mhp operon transcriptional activator